MPREPDVRYVVAPNLTAEQAAKGEEALRDLARRLGRASAQACHKLGIEPDMDDPEVAREIMITTLEALVLSKPAPRANTSSKPAD